MTFPTGSELGRPGSLARGWSNLLIGLTGLVGMTGLAMLGAGCAGQQTSSADASDATPSEAAAAEDDGLFEEPEESWGDDDASHQEESSASPSTASNEEEIVETRTMEVIQEVVTKNRAQVRQCYDQTREKHPNLPGGDFTLTILIDPEGAVKNVEQNLDRSTLRSPDLTKCAVAAVKTWKFPPSSRGMESTVNYPFNFKP